MNLRILFIIILTAALTAFFMQNSEPVTVKVLFDTMTISKLALLPGLLIFGFLLGYITGRTGRSNAKRLKEASLSTDVINQAVPPSQNQGFFRSTGRIATRDPGQLSAEDETYLKE